MAAIFDFSLIRTSGSARGTLVVLPDLENMDMAVGILLLSFMETEIYVMTLSNSEQCQPSSIYILSVHRAVSAV